LNEPSEKTSTLAYVFTAFFIIVFLCASFKTTLKKLINLELPSEQAQEGPKGLSYREWYLQVCQTYQRQVKHLIELVLRGKLSVV